MNYLDVGLPHTEFYPRKQLLSPPRNIPMSGLSRKYMGLEPVSKSEIEGIIRRLSQPKITITEENPEKIFKQHVKGTGRFVGKKRMSRSQISKMVERLCSRGTSAEERTVTGEKEDQDSDSDETGVTDYQPVAPSASVLEKRSSLVDPKPDNRRLSVRFQDQDHDTDTPIKIIVDDAKGTVTNSKDSLKTKYLDKNNTIASGTPKSNQFHLRQGSTNFHIKTGNAVPKYSPRSPRVVPGTPRNGIVRPTSPRATSVKMGDQQRPVAKTSKVAKNGKSEVVKKSDMKIRIRLDEIDEHAINKIARLNKSPRDVKL